MRQKILAVLILFLAVVLVGYVYHMSTHDKVSKVLALNELQLHKGRRVFLIGIQVPGESEFARAGLKMETILGELNSLLLDQPVVLAFDSNFEPDSSSEDLHAYFTLADGRDLGAWLIEQGYAKSNPLHQHREKDHYGKLEEKARLAKVGIWNL